MSLQSQSKVDLASVESACSEIKTDILDRIAALGSSGACAASFPAPGENDSSLSGKQGESKEDGRYIDEHLGVRG